MSEDGPKLIEADEEAVLALRLEQPRDQIVPELEYGRQYIERAEAGARRFERTSTPARARHAKPARAGRRAPRPAQAGGVGFEVVSSADPTPVGNASVSVFVDGRRTPIEGRTDASGKVRLRLPARATVIGFIVQASFGFWSLVRRTSSLASTTRVRLKPLDLTAPDVLRTVYRSRSVTDGRGVRVGVTDWA